MQTGNVDLFTKLWWEVSAIDINRICDSRNDALESGSRWFPCKKGGTFRKWYGNDEWIMNWENDGFALRANHGSVVRNPDAQFKESISWSKISGDQIGARYYPNGWMFDQAGSTIEASKEQLLILLALINCSTAMSFFAFLSPSLTFGIGEMAKVPYKNR